MLGLIRPFFLVPAAADDPIARFGFSHGGRDGIEYRLKRGRLEHVHPCFEPSCAHQMSMGIREARKYGSSSQIDYPRRGIQPCVGTLVAAHVDDSVIGDDDGRRPWVGVVHRDHVAAP